MPRNWHCSVLISATIALLAGPAHGLGPKEVVPFKNKALAMLNGGLQVSPQLRAAILKLTANKRADGWAKRGLEVFGRSGWTNGSYVALPAASRAGTWDLRWWKASHYSMPTPLSSYAKALSNGNTLQLDLVKKEVGGKVRSEYTFTVFGRLGEPLAAGRSLEELNKVSPRVLGKGVPLKKLLDDAARW